MMGAEIGSLDAAAVEEKPCKPCDKCGEPHQGFEPTCDKCRKSKRGSILSCRTCGSCFSNDHCEDCGTRRLNHHCSLNDIAGSQTRTPRSAKTPFILICCAEPARERTQTLKHHLEDQGAIVQVKTDTDLSFMQQTAPEVPRGRSSKVMVANNSYIGELPRTPLQQLNRGWRTPDEPQARSPSPSCERSADSLTESSSPSASEPCDAVLVLWSQYFQGALHGQLKALTDAASKRGALILNDIDRIVEMQDRRWLLKKLQEAGVPSPFYVECSRNQRCPDPTVEEHNDFIVINGQRINKPFVEKPVDRRDREIYVYFPKSTGGGRALASTRESGDMEYVCRFDQSMRVRREGSFIYQEYLQSDGVVVQAVCAGGYAYGNAVHQGVMTSLKSESHMHGEFDSTAMPIILRQEEKLVAEKLRVVMQQTLFGITFVRAQNDKGKITSYVIDVWPGVPRVGFGTFSDEVARALLFAIARRRPSSHLARSRSCEDMLVECRESTEAESFKDLQKAPDVAKGNDHDDDDPLCVILMCRHGARTPKQKAKAKVEVGSEYAAGWLLGWLAGAGMDAMVATKPPPSFDLRAPDQLQRLNVVAKKWKEEGQKLGTFADALSNFDQLGEACHAKVSTDGRLVTVAIKWGGELTSLGIKDSEELGASFRSVQGYEDLHVGSLRHDTKVYSSSEPRCQQTAAAFCKGFMQLSTAALPPIIAALVRKDGWGTLEAGGPSSSIVMGGGAAMEPGKNAEKNGDTKDSKADAKQTKEKEKTGNSGNVEDEGKKAKKDKAQKKDKKDREEGEEVASSGQLDSVEESWKVVEALPFMDEDVVKEAFCAAVSAPALAPFEAPGPAMRELGARIEKLREALKGDCRPLHNAESVGLVRERYKDAVGDLQLSDNPGQPKSFEKLEKLLDNLQYDMTYNREALPEEARQALELATPLCDALCSAQAVLEVARNIHRDAGHPSTGVSFLWKLRWDLKVASGVDLGDVTHQLCCQAHKQKHDLLYSSSIRGKPCVRTRLYFSHNSHLQRLLIALYRWRMFSTGYTKDAAKADAVVTKPLGFLAHFIIRLTRNRVTNALRVTCEFGRNKDAEKVCLFDCPLSTADAWFADMLKGVPDPTQGAFPTDQPS